VSRTFLARGTSRQTRRNFASADDHRRQIRRTFRQC
jgi:hypothetical protein